MKQLAIKSRLFGGIKPKENPAKPINSNRAPVVYLLALAVMFWNILEADSARFAFAQSAQGGYLNIDPATANQILRSLNEFTPVINEDNIDLEMAFDPTLNEGFASADDIAEKLTTEESDLEVEYVIKKGDTLSGIAARHDTTVATLIDRNKLSLNEIESLKLGETIVIPPKITSNSTKWLEQLQSKRAQEQQQIAAARTSTGTQRAASGYSSVASRDLRVPIRYRYISRGLLSYHFGIDYVANTGTPVHAAQTGKVIEITRGWAGGFGISVLIDHGGGLTTRYAHLSSVAVSIGQNVGQGQLIAYSGNTGYSTGPHLHFETRLHGRAIYPY